jgi:regulator of PEP synthase PpsR (kinase-PPPase family)
LKSSDKGGAAHIRDNDYLDFDCIETEIRKGRRLFSKKGWPVIDVTKRSIEETAAEIMALLQARQDKYKAAQKAEKQQETTSE